MKKKNDFFNLNSRMVLLKPGDKLISFDTNKLIQNLMDTNRHLEK